MGYTHYFTMHKEPSVTRFRKFSGQVRKLVQAAGKRDIKVCFDLEYPNTQPLISADAIRFNGPGELGHETFVLEREPGRSFCKTALKPYDLVVASVLLLASKTFDQFELASDGFNTDGTYDQEWDEAIAFTNEVLGEEYTL